MAAELTVAAGQYSDKGRKPTNQDFHGICIPPPAQLRSKGVAVALADGIGSSDVSHIASQSAVAGFLADYFSTSEAWSVKTSARRVLAAINSWLYSQTRRSPYRYDKDRGYVCTLSALVIKSVTAHIFHVGDTRIYRLRDQQLEQLTTDHRIAVSAHTSYLSRALGLDAALEIDYQALPVEVGDIFLLASDGVYEHVTTGQLIEAIATWTHELDRAAQVIVETAYHAGSPDNLTVQIVRIDGLPAREAAEVYPQWRDRPAPPVLEAGAVLDGYTITRTLHASSRSHVYLALDRETDTPVVIKAPSIDLRDDPAYLERFLLEEWIARRIHSAHVLKPCPSARKRNYLYTVTEFIEGRTLSQWLIDHPEPGLETVRGIIEQIGKGLLAFHRLEMLHQDLRPDNIMIDGTGTAKIIDFGSTRVAGVAEIGTPAGGSGGLGTVQYTAPECLLGERGSERSDLFSLGVIAYQLLSGELPYGTRIAQCTSRAQQTKLKYRSLRNTDRAIPAWVDGAIRQAVDPEPRKRYGEVSEFVYDLRHPNRAFLDRPNPPLMERHPLLFWKALSLTLAMIVLVLLGVQYAGP